jgi:hypothetical protein
VRAVAWDEGFSQYAGPEVCGGAEHLCGVYGVQCVFGFELEDVAGLGEWEVGSEIWGCWGAAAAAARKGGEGGRWGGGGCECRGGEHGAEV